MIASLTPGGQHDPNLVSEGYHGALPKTSSLFSTPFPPRFPREDFAMRYLALPTLVLLTCAPLLAEPQDKTVSSPPGFETKSGDYYGIGYFGQYTNQRLQSADAQFNQVMSIKEISYRLDGGRTYAANSNKGGVGRTWTNVTLHMSECDYNKMTSTFAANPLTTPQKVFDAKMTWQTFVGAAPDPAPWGGQGIKFPFTSTWVYTNAKDILLEYVFQGGTLANNATWTGTTYARYYLDGVNSTTYTLGSKTEYPGGGSQASSYKLTTPPYCVDSAQSAAYPTKAARNDILGIFAYNANASTTNRNNISLSWRAFYTAPLGASVIKAMGPAGNPAGVNIGAMCNKLYLDMTQPFWLFLDTTNNPALPYTSGTTSLNTPFQTAYGGVSLWFQCAWTESKTNFFSLTTATQRWVPTSIPPVAPRRQTVRKGDLTATTGTGPSFGATSNPLYLFRYQ